LLTFNPEEVFFFATALSPTKTTELYALERNLSAGETELMTQGKLTPGALSIHMFIANILQP
jgi:hypothetical protein